jgi:hypothetical protein
MENTCLNRHKAPRRRVRRCLPYTLHRKRPCGKPARRKLGSPRVRVVPRSFVTLAPFQEDSQESTTENAASRPRNGATRRLFFLILSSRESEEKRQTHLWQNPNSQLFRLPVGPRGRPWRDTSSLKPGGVTGSYGPGLPPRFSPTHLAGPAGGRPLSTERAPLSGAAR